MKINIPNRLPENNPTRYTGKKMTVKGKGILFVLCLCVLSVVVGLSILSQKEVKVWINDWAVKHGHDALRNDILLRYALLKFPGRVLQSFISSNKNLPRIYIDIKYKHIQKINQKRMKALSDGILVQGPDDLVPATIRYNNRSINAELRLKGDWTDHLEGRKWSFRIHTKGKDQLFGMRRFSIQHPKVRGFHGEPLFMETLRHVGVLALRYFFVDVVVNGDDLGIMAIEEHFSKELLEFNDRREGVIVCYDESLLWDARVLMGGYEYADPVFSSYKNTAVNAFRSAHIAKSPALSDNLTVAVGLLRGFTSGDLRASEVFDVELMGRFLGVLEFLGSRHAMYWHNLRFYLNPITLKLEPIGFDSDLQSRYRSNQTISQFSPPLIMAILNDPKIFDVYHETLLKLSKEVLDGSLIDKLQMAQDPYLRDLRKEFYLLEPFPFEQLKKRASFFRSIEKYVLKEPVSYPKLLHAFLIDDKEGSRIEILNAVPHEIDILSIKWVAKNDPDSAMDFHSESGIQFPMTIPATPPGELPVTQTISYEYSENLNNFSLTISASVKESHKRYTHVAQRYFASLKDHPVPTSTPTEQRYLHPFLIIDEAERKLHVKKGLWEVKDSIVVPPDYDLTVSEGTTLTISKGKGIFASGCLIFKGTAENPIVIRGASSGDGKSSETWEGIFVQHSKRLSEWSHVTVRDTKSINYRGWNLTGGVNFYKSNVHLADCVFKNSHGEDALNIVNSEFLIVNTDFVSTMSDAFDADFSVGNIEGCTFRDIGKSGGGDAVDISGSKVSVLGTFFENINDKALSVGEKSTMSAKNIRVRNAGAGAVSKDGSYLEIKDSDITQAVHAGLMAYIKKQEFGPALIVANNVKYSGPAPFARAEKGSEISVDGKNVETEDMDVAEMYDSIMRPGNRK